jgi:hypothetical protein
MRAELDQADRYRGEICDAIDGRAGERTFLHPRIIDELRAERDALLKANAHRANEIENVRKEYASFREAIYGASGVPDGKGYDIIQIYRDSTKDALSLIRVTEERDELKAQFARAIVPLPRPERVEPGQRWAIVMGTASDCRCGSTIYKFIDADGSPYFANEDDIAKSYYLGTDKV